ncbi:M1 family metallopeptidase [Sphingomonas suaedae]|uniref:Aminopeptidase N n=1 Tax=Sphingomonas suaedae TaxID=2599297 RepID=A0A518RD32_9SPHN|nr:M1 family metallopeptidase [Sphingomonas suaedae]QDX25360.1 M1 family metallopeptidase [Sphingomonas suaedae]
MDTPVLPTWGRVAHLYGERGQRINAVFTAIALLGCCGTASAQRGEPPITPLTALSGGPVEPERAALRLEHVDLDLTVDPARKLLSGTAQLTLSTSIRQTRLLIDLDTNLAVSGVRIDGVALAPGSWRNPEGRLAIDLPRPVPAGGKVIARIDYGGRPHEAVNAPWDDGIVWSSWQGKPWVATTAQGYGCDLFWPCLDFPAGEVKAIRLAITTPGGEPAIANGRLMSVRPLPDGGARWTWEARNINPYLIAINIGPYREIKGRYASRFGNKIPLHLWHLAGKDRQAAGLFAEFAPTLDFFETMIGPYPFADEKLGVVETPHLGMEHQTVNAYGNDYRKDETGFDWLFQHELAHEWFGNQMTAANWDDFWLHEGYGQYMQPLYGQWREGEARYAAMMATQRRYILNRQPLVSGRVKASDEVYQSEKGGPGQDIYYKGAWVLHTLRYLIGDKPFFDATRRLVYGRPDPKPGNFVPRFTSTAEFETLMNAAAGRDLGWFFDIYLREAALPELVETRTGDRLTLAWKTARQAPFPLPVDVQIDGQVRRLAMAGGRETVRVPASAHVVVDPMARILRRSSAIEAMQRR